MLFYVGFFFLSWVLLMVTVLSFNVNGLGDMGKVGGIYISDMSSI